MARPNTDTMQYMVLFSQRTVQLPANIEIFRYFSSSTSFLWMPELVLYGIRELAPAMAGIKP